MMQRQPHYCYRWLRVQRSTAFQPTSLSKGMCGCLGEFATSDGSETSENYAGADHGLMFACCRCMVVKFIDSAIYTSPR